MQLPEFRSPVARAVLPVLGGIVLLAVLAGFTWGMATYISRSDTSTSDRLAPSEFVVGPVVPLADTVRTEGPLLFPELGTAIGTRSIVVDHTGDVAADNWRVYWAYPADRDATCVVDQVVGTSTFIDCDGRSIDVTDLSPPDQGVYPEVQNRTTLIVVLRDPDVTAVPATTTP